MMQAKVAEVVFRFEIVLVREAGFADIDAHHLGLRMVIRQTGRDVGSAASDKDLQVFARRSIGPEGATHQYWMAPVSDWAFPDIMDRVRIVPTFALGPATIRWSA